MVGRLGGALALSLVLWLAVDWTAALAVLRHAGGAHGARRIPGEHRQRPDLRGEMAHPAAAKSGRGRLRHRGPALLDRRLLQQLPAHRRRRRCRKADDDTVGARPRSGGREHSGGTPLGSCGDAGAECHGARPVAARPGPLAAPERAGGHRPRTPGPERPLPARLVPSHADAGRRDRSSLPAAAARAMYGASRPACWVRAQTRARSRRRSPGRCLSTAR